MYFLDHYHFDNKYNQYWNYYSKKKKEQYSLLYISMKNLNKFRYIKK